MVASGSNDSSKRCETRNHFGNTGGSIFKFSGLGCEKKEAPGTQSNAHSGSKIASGGRLFIQTEREMDDETSKENKTARRASVGNGDTNTSTNNSAVTPSSVRVSSFHLSDPKIQTGNLSFKTHPLNSLFYIDPKTGTKASSWRCFGPERVDKAKSRGEQRRYGKRYERRRRISTKQQQRKNSNCCGR